MEWWIWVVAGFLLLALELASPGGFYVFFFGCGALAVGLLAALGWAEPLALQGVLFGGLSVAALVFFRPLIVRRLRAGVGDAAVDSLVGERARVRGEIAANGFGKAELRGTRWNARNVGAAPLGPDQACRVERVEGLTLWIRAE
jgi:membrane protein implicated in regulation of membrane protease activity